MYTFSVRIFKALWQVYKADGNVLDLDKHSVQVSSSAVLLREGVRKHYLGSGRDHWELVWISHAINLFLGGKRW